MRNYKIKYYNEWLTRILVILCAPSPNCNREVCDLRHFLIDFSDLSINKLKLKKKSSYFFCTKFYYINDIILK